MFLDCAHDMRDDVVVLHL